MRREVFVARAPAKPLRRSRSVRCISFDPKTLSAPRVTTDPCFCNTHGLSLPVFLLQPHGGVILVRGGRATGGRRACWRLEIRSGGGGPGRISILRRSMAFPDGNSPLLLSLSLLSPPPPLALGLGRVMVRASRLCSRGPPPTPARMGTGWCSRGSREGAGWCSCGQREGAGGVPAGRWRGRGGGFESCVH